MRSLLLTLSRSPLLLLIVALTILYSPAPQARYDMGFVVEADLETPIPGLHLALVDAATQQTITTFTTDENGSFAYGDLAPGQYELRVLTDGFLKPFPYFIPSQPFCFEIDGETPPDMVLALLPLVTSDISRLGQVPFLLPQSADGTRAAFYTSFLDADPLSLRTIFAVIAPGEFDQLTDATANDYDPDLSPDAASIAFTSDRDDGDGSSDLDIYLMNYDGTEARQLTNDALDNFDPVWSPDGERLAFITESGSGDQHIYVVDADGDNLTALTSGTTRDFSPVWSPDGSQIAFASTRNGSYDIYLINADGTGLAALTSDPTDEFDPIWSPDRTQVVFSAYRDRAMFEMPLYEIQPDGSMVEMGTTMPELDLTTYDPYRDLSLFSVWAVDLATGDVMPLDLPAMGSYAARFAPDLRVYGIDSGWNDGMLAEESALFSHSREPALLDYETRYGIVFYPGRGEFWDGWAPGQSAVMTSNEYGIQLPWFVGAQGEFNNHTDAVRNLPLEAVATDGPLFWGNHDYFRDVLHVFPRSSLQYFSFYYNFPLPPHCRVTVWQMLRWNSRNYTGVGLIRNNSAQWRNERSRRRYYPLREQVRATIDTPQYIYFEVEMRILPLNGGRVLDIEERVIASGILPPTVCVNADFDLRL